MKRSLFSVFFSFSPFVRGVLPRAHFSASLQTTLYCAGNTLPLHDSFFAFFPSSTISPPCPVPTCRLSFPLIESRQFWSFLAPPTLPERGPLVHFSFSMPGAPLLRLAHTTFSPLGWRAGSTTYNSLGEDSPAWLPSSFPLGRDSTS